MIIAFATITISCIKEIVSLVKVWLEYKNSPNVQPKIQPVKMSSALRHKSRFRFIAWSSWLGVFVGIAVSVFFFVSEARDGSPLDRDGLVNMLASTTLFLVTVGFALSCLVARAVSIWGRFACDHGARNFEMLAKLREGLKL